MAGWNHSISRDADARADDSSTMASSGSMSSSTPKLATVAEPSSPRRMGEVTRAPLRSSPVLTVSRWHVQSGAVRASWMCFCAACRSRPAAPVRTCTMASWFCSTLSPPKLIMSSATPFFFRIRPTPIRLASSSGELMASGEPTKTTMRCRWFEFCRFFRTSCKD